jgi:hypothetical protein
MATLQLLTNFVKHRAKTRTSALSRVSDAVPEAAAASVEVVARRGATPDAAILAPQKKRAPQRAAISCSASAADEGG